MHAWTMRRACIAPDSVHVRHACTQGDERVGKSSVRSRTAGLGYAGVERGAAYAELAVDL
jgi:hypothetical protein